MSTDRDVTRTVRSWLKEDGHEDADRVLDSVLDHLDTTPQRRAQWLARRFSFMSNPVRIAIAAAAVLAVIVLGITLLPRQNVGVTQPSSPTPTAYPTFSIAPEMTPLPTEAALPGAGALAPGTYVIDDPFPLRVSLTTDGGWRVWSGITTDGAAIYKNSFDPPAGIGIVVVVVHNVYADPCDPAKGSLVPQLGPGVDDLATALAGQVGTEASPATDVTLDGYSGKYLEYTMTGAGSCPGNVHRFPTVAGPREAVQTEHDQVWILDVDGVRLMIDAFSFPGASEADLAELREVVDAIQIQP